MNAAGTTYVADSNNHTIRSITPDGTVSTLAGLAGSPGNVNGSGSAARFSTPTGVAVDTAGTIYVADKRQPRHPEDHAAGVVSTFVTLDCVHDPNCIAVAADGTSYVGARPALSAVLLKITSDGTVTTLASGPSHRLGSVASR